MSVNLHTLLNLGIGGNPASGEPAFKPFPVTLIFLLLGIALFMGCVVRGLPVAVDYTGTAVHTQVDSELARYYLAHYRQGERLRPLFDVIIERSARMPLGRLLERDVLAGLAQRYSTDFAAAVLIDRLRAVPANRMADERFRALITSSAIRDGRDPKHRYRILFVPGWAYRSRPQTGALVPLYPVCGFIFCCSIWILLRPIHV